MKQGRKSVKKEAAVAADWAKLTEQTERLLRLKTSPVAYKRLEKVKELDKIFFLPIEIVVAMK